MLIFATSMSAPQGHEIRDPMHRALSSTVPPQAAHWHTVSDHLCLTEFIFYLVLLTFTCLDTRATIYSSHTGKYEITTSPC